MEAEAHVKSNSPAAQGGVGAVAVGIIFGDRIVFDWDSNLEESGSGQVGRWEVCFEGKIKIPGAYHSFRLPVQPWLPQWEPEILWE